MLKKNFSILARSTHTNVCIRISFNTLSLSLSFFLSSFLAVSRSLCEVWKLQRSCRLRNLTGHCAAPHQTLDNYAPMKVRPFANSFEVAFKSRFSSKCHADLCDAGRRPLLCLSTSGVQFSFLIEHDHGSLVHGRKPLFRWRLDRHLLVTEVQVEQRPCQYCQLKTKKRAKRRSWCVPGPLKRGQEHFSCPLLSGPGTLSTHYRARMVFSSPYADIADWSMP